MTKIQFKNEETQAIHAGWRADATTNSVAVPIYQTTSYQFNDSDHAENLFALKELGYETLTKINHEGNDRKALKYNRNLLMENFILPNRLKFPLFRNILENYFI